MEIDGVSYCPRCMLPWTETEACGHCGYQAQKSPPLCYTLEECTVLQQRYLVGVPISTGKEEILYAAWDFTHNRPVRLREYYPFRYARRTVERSDQVYHLSGRRSKNAFRSGLRRFLQRYPADPALPASPTRLGSSCFYANGTVYAVEHISLRNGFRGLAD